MMDAKNMTVTDWAIDNGYDEIETYTSDEFVAWHAHEYDPAEMHGPTFTGVKACATPMRLTSGLSPSSGTRTASSGVAVAWVARCCKPCKTCETRK